MCVLTLFLLMVNINLWAENIPIIKDNTPEWLIPLRETVYEQVLNADAIKPLYLDARSAAQERYSNTDLNLALSRCEFFMGRALQDSKREDEARVHYVEGMRLAENVLETAISTLAWQSLAENLAQACSIGPWTFTMANGLNVERFARNALSFNDRNAAAQYLIAARWIFAPAPFNNIRRGIQMMKDILETCDMGKDDLFNVYSAIGYGYIQQRRFNDARPWLQKSLELYPTNKYAAEMLEKT